MKDQKILNGDQISWYLDDVARLDYRMAFENEGIINNDHDKGSSDSEEQIEKVDVRALLKERDEKWKKRLKKVSEDSFKRGFKKGEQQGIEKTRKEMDERFDKLEYMFNQAHEEWVKRHEILNPGVLDLVFDIVDAIVDIPIEHTKMKEYLEKELSALLHNLDEGVKPVLNICEDDYEFVAKLVKKYAPEITVDIRKSSNCNPGEFELDTEKETVVYKFKEMVGDFKEDLTLPTWK
ncbi:MAG TPA: hypothetical protein VE912_11930 [Bacteroidales bacterium]|nr:hypothetical protein [Bacteroidales bacterium]